MGNLKSHPPHDPDMGDSIFISNTGMQDVFPDFESDPRTIREKLTQKRDVKDFPLVYHTKQELGEGMTGKVSKLVDNRKQERAVKLTYGYDRADKPQVRELRSEIFLLRLLDHPNLVRFVEYYEEPPSDLRLVVDMCKGGNLASASGKARLQGREDRIAFVVYQLFLAVKYLHDRGVAHRDIKEENVMFVFANQDSLYIQLIDLGLASYVGYNLRPDEEAESKHGDQTAAPTLQRTNSLPRVPSVRRLRTFCGTLPYMSPEVLTANYDLQCDLWSMGVLIFELVTGTLPFMGDTDRKLIKQIKHAKIDYSSPSWNRLSPSALDLVKHLLVPAAEHLRWTADMALRSPWFTECRKQAEAVEDQLERALVEEGMARYAQYNIFRRMAMQCVAHYLPPQSTIVLEKLYRCFLAIDLNYDGMISEDELSPVLQAHGYSAQRATELFAELDYDGHGHITWTNFIAIGTEVVSGVLFDQTMWAKVFDYVSLERRKLKTSRLLDLVGDGIKSEERKRLEEMVRIADTDADGYVEKDEFIRLIAGQ